MTALTGVKVLEFAADGPVGFCAMLLADLGANVLRIARPGTGRAPLDVPVEKDPLVGNRPTRRVDLKSKGGRDLARRLIGRADILLEGYRPGVMERLGLGPEVASQLNPCIVYARATGWGQTGPYAHMPGHDLNFLSVTGLLHCLGSPDDPPCVPLNVIADFAGGGLFLALGTVCALFQARGGRQTRVVDSAMIDGVSRLMTSVHALCRSGQWQGQRRSNLLDGGAPWYSVYETSDRKFVSVACVEPAFFEKFLGLLGLPQAYSHRQFDRQSWREMRSAIASTLRGRSRDDWCRLLCKENVCFSPVLTMDEARGDPQIKARRILETTLGNYGTAWHLPVPQIYLQPGAAASPQQVNISASAEPLLEWGIAWEAPESGIVTSASPGRE